MRKTKLSRLKIVFNRKTGNAGHIEDLNLEYVLALEDVENFQR